MPFVRIDLIKGRPLGERQVISEVVYQTMVEALNVPENDRFQVMTEHLTESFVFDPSYLHIQRSAGCIFIQITLNAGRSLEVKKAFYARLASELEQRVGLRPQDLFINLVEVAKENWSFGNGEAQYAL